MTQTEGHTKTSITRLQIKKNENILDSSVISVNLSKTCITSLFDLFIHKLFVKLKFNLHYFSRGQANIRGVGRSLFLKTIYEQQYLVSPSLSKIIDNRSL